jgi:hypothetical protein
MHEPVSPAEVSPMYYDLLLGTLLALMLVGPAVMTAIHRVRSRDLYY